MVTSATTDAECELGMPPAPTKREKSIFLVSIRMIITFSDWAMSHAKNTTFTMLLLVSVCQKVNANSSFLVVY